jgi:hypothetical protein
MKPNGIHVERVGEEWVVRIETDRHPRVFYCSSEKQAREFAKFLAKYSLAPDRARKGSPP